MVFGNLSFENDPSHQAIETDIVSIIFRVVESLSYLIMPVVKLVTFCVFSSCDQKRSESINV